MDLEIEAINKNKTWKLVKPPLGAKVIGVKRVYRTKLNENGEIDKCKARLVAKGVRARKRDRLQRGVCPTAPVSRWDTIRMIISLVARNGWKLYHLMSRVPSCTGSLLKKYTLHNHKVMR